MFMIFRDIGVSDLLRLLVSRVMIVLGCGLDQGVLSLYSSTPFPLEFFLGYV